MIQLLANFILLGLNNMDTVRVDIYAGYVNENTKQNNNIFSFFLNEKTKLA